MNLFVILSAVTNAASLFCTWGQLPAWASFMEQEYPFESVSTSFVWGNLPVSIGSNSTEYMLGLQVSTVHVYLYLCICGAFAVHLCICYTVQEIIFCGPICNQQHFGIIYLLVCSMLLLLCSKSLSTSSSHSATFGKCNKIGRKLTSHV